MFILTHHAREPVEFDNGTTFTFVTDGIEAALEQARAAAGDKDVLVAGGADAIRQAVEAGAVEDFQLARGADPPGRRRRLFDGIASPPKVELTRVIDSPAATHLSYRVVT